MKKTILAVLLSTLMYGVAVADEQAVNMEDDIEATEIYSDEGGEEIDEEASYLTEHVDCIYDAKGENDTLNEELSSDCVQESNDELAEVDVNEALVEATEDNLQTLLSSCEEYTLEDGISEGDANSYLITCINNILSESGYYPINTLPQREYFQDIKR